MKRTLVSALIALTGLGIAGGYTANVSPEYQLKAVFLLNLAGYVEWPDTLSSGSDKPLVVGVFGKDPFGGALEEAARAKSINGRRIVIRISSELASLRTCHMVFFPASQMRGYAHVAGALSELNILTVGETSGFTDSGGMINFVIHNALIGFEINLMAAKRSHLKISSKLLQLAILTGS